MSTVSEPTRSNGFREPGNNRRAARRLLAPVIARTFNEYAALAQFLHARASMRALLYAVPLAAGAGGILTGSAGFAVGLYGLAACVPVAAGLVGTWRPAGHIGALGVRAAYPMIANDVRNTLADLRHSAEPGATYYGRKIDLPRLQREFEDLDRMNLELTRKAGDGVWQDASLAMLAAACFTPGSAAPGITEIFLGTCMAHSVLCLYEREKAASSWHRFQNFNARTIFLSGRNGSHDDLIRRIVSDAEGPR